MTDLPTIGLPDSDAAPSTPGVGGPAAPPGKRKRLKRLNNRDKMVLAAMVAIPVLIEAALIWIPTLLSIGLSFTKWNGLDLSNIRSNGVQNYNYVLNDYPAFWPAIRHNILWLLFLGFIATPLGLLIAVLLDQQLRGAGSTRPSSSCRSCFRSRWSASSGS